MNASINHGEGKSEDMARKKRVARRASVKRKKPRKTESKQSQNRALIAILALLLLLHLIDEKTFDGVTSTLKPRKKDAKRRRRKSESQRKTIREKKTYLSRKS